MKNLNLNVKLIGGFAVVVVLMALLIAINIIDFERLATLQDTGAERARNAAIAEEASGTSEKLYKIVADSIINRDPERTKKEWTITVKEATEDFKKLEEIADTENEKELVKKTTAAFNELIRIVEKELTPLVDMSADITQGIRDLDAKIDDQISAMSESTHSFAENLVTESKKADEEFNNTIQSIITTNLIIGAVIAVAGLLLGIFLSRSITRPINTIISGLTEGAGQVVSAASQVSSASQSLAEGASEQAASIEETSSSLEEMSSMTKQNADNATQADNLMKEANHVVKQANSSMDELTKSMSDISKASEETSKIIKTIDEIAFQTNLLALNAAVEAARAGEAGAGFAVVADEVRNLAMRAADAAKNTANLIEGTVKKVKDGSELVVKTNEAFTEVAKSSAKVGSLVAEIAAASNEQAQGIDQVNKAVAEMDKVVQQNAANAEESASASEEMNAQAEQMKLYVGDLAAVISGNGNRKNGAEAPHVIASNGKSIAASGGSRIKTEIYAVKTAPKGNGKKNPVVKFKNLNPEDVIPLEEGDFKDF